MTFEEKINKVKESLKSKYEYKIVKDGERKAIVECTSMAYDDSLWEECHNMIKSIAATLYCDNTDVFNSKEEACDFLFCDEYSVTADLKDYLISLMSIVIIDKYEEF